MSQAQKEVLYLFRNSDDWPEPHTERHLLNVPGNVSLLDLHLQLPHDINAFAFSKYVKMYLRGRSMGATKEPIRAPFLPKPTAVDTRDSLDTFKLILLYSFDEKLSEKRQRIVANLLIQKGLSSESLRDEIYVQLCNQTLHSRTGIFGDPANIWMLIAACLGSFQPSQFLSKFLLKYVSDSLNSLGYGVVCQQKLLQSIGTDFQPPRSYPPCALEWLAIKRKACMSLTTLFADGISMKGQVESWTTAELFAANLLYHRRLSGGSSGWTVVLRDERESYECPGHDYVLDLISEIEISPCFPCGTAYFIATADHTRPASNAAGNRYKWPDQPHNTDRLRLVPMEVDEVPDSHLSGHASASLRSSASDQPPSQPPPPPPPPPLPQMISSDNVYATVDEALSQDSALNKRSDKVPEILSKSSALNSRYRIAAELAEKQQLPPPQSNLASARPDRTTAAAGEQGQTRQVNGGHQSNRKKRRDSGGGEDMDSWLEEVFQGVGDDRNMADLRNSRSVERRLKGGGDDFTQQLSMPLGLGIGGLGLYQPTTTSALLNQPVGLSNPLFSSPIYPQSYATAQPLLQPSLQSSFIPQQSQGNFGLGAALANNPTYMHQQQQQQQQQLQMLNQQTAQLQVQLQKQELEKKFLQSSLETEILRHQLHQVQQQTRPLTEQSTSSGAVPSTTKNLTSKFQTQVNSRPISKKPPPRVVPDEPEDEEEEEDVEEADDYRPSAQSQKRQSVPAKKKVDAARKSSLSSPPPQRKSDDSKVHSIMRNSGPSSANHTKEADEKSKGVTFSTEVVTISSSESDKKVPPPPPPPLQEDESSKKSDKSTEIAKSKPVSSAAAGSQRRPPNKIGQIIWPPPPPDKDERPKYEPGRLQIDEAKESLEKVIPTHSPEEAQRKVQEKILMAKKKAAAEEEEELLKQNQARTSLSGDDNRRDSVLDEDKFHALDMNTRRKTLQSKLTHVGWGAKVRKSASIIATAPQSPPAPFNDQGAPLDDQQAIFDLSSIDNIRTVLHAQSTDPFYTYGNVNWCLEIRKEVFRPLERLVDPDIIYLVFCQIVYDIFSNDCIRLSKDDKRKMSSLLDKYNINLNNVTANHSPQDMVAIVEVAKSLPLYFSRFFAVNGGQRLRRVQMVAISHSGVRLLTRIKDVTEDYIEVLETISFEDIQSVTVPKNGALLLRANGRNFVLYTSRVNQICQMIEDFRVEKSKAGNRINSMDRPKMNGQHHGRSDSNR